jgi:hypothetical protein
MRARQNCLKFERANLCACLTEQTPQGLISTKSPQPNASLIQFFKLAGQSVNLFWDFRIVGFVVLPRQLIHLLLYLFAVIGVGISPGLISSQGLGF